MTQQRQLELINHVFGHWNGHEWESAKLTEDQVDLSFFEQAIVTAHLEEKRKRVVLLRCAGLTFKQIGKQLNISGGRAQDLFFNARRKLGSPTNRKHIRRACVLIS